MPDTHIHMILHGFPKNKQFRPKYLIKEEYDNSLDEKFEEPPALKTRDRDKTLNITKFPWWHQGFKTVLVWPHFQHLWPLFEKNDRE